MIGYQNVLKMLDNEFAEMEQIVHNSTTIVAAVLKQAGGKFIIPKSKVEEAVQSPYKDVRLDKKDDENFVLIGVDNDEK